MSNTSTQIVVSVEGMTCGGCANTITNALRSMGSNITSEVDVANATATVSGPSNIITFDSVVSTIESVGFDASACGSKRQSNQGGGKCSAGEECTCGDNCECGTNCTCKSCSGSCGASTAKTACAAKAKNTCTCGDSCQCGESCACDHCPGNTKLECESKASGCCSADKDCSCGDNCQCGDDCTCDHCPGKFGKEGKGCPSVEKGTCTCGKDSCMCGENCACAGCPGKVVEKKACEAVAAGTCTCGPGCDCGENCKCASCPAGDCKMKGSGMCCAGDSCTCGPTCGCGDDCRCASCPALKMRQERIGKYVTGVGLIAALALIFFFRKRK